MQKGNKHIRRMKENIRTQNKKEINKDRRKTRRALSKREMETETEIKHEGIEKERKKQTKTEWEIKREMENENKSKFNGSHCRTSVWRT
jgi:hypothetical protein